mgnify:CR=1 FL=1
MLTSAELRQLGDPLAFLQSDHLREREICTLLDRIAAAPVVDQQDRRDVLIFLREVLPFHLADEEHDLFSVLRERCEPEDQIEKVFDRLLAEHGHAANCAPEVTAILERYQPGDGALSGPERAVLSRYATQARRHLVLENAIVIPFARLRLSEKDRDELRLRMLERRGLNRLWEGANDD